jgi:putative ABC transport system permease protein
MLARAGLRHLLRHPALAGLSVLGVALGVAVVVAVDLANASASRAFVLSGEAVAGRATHQVVGGPGGLPAAVYLRLRRAGGVAAAPVVEGYARAAADTTRVLQVLGVDPFMEEPFRPYLGPAAGADLPGLLVEPGAALLSAETAAALGLAPGARFGVVVDGRPERARVAGVLSPEDDRSRSALRDLLVVDVATAQEWLGMAGGVGGRVEGEGSPSLPDPRTPTPPYSAEGGLLSRVDLVVPEDAAGEAALATLRAALPPGVEVRAAGARTQALETMTAAFRTNLAALSLLALVVGVFLIYNTVTFSVVQRRRLVGTYRALGVTRREVFSSIVGEAFGLGVVGAALGVGLGVLLGEGLVRAVTQTITDLYFVVRVREAALPAGSLVKGFGLGVGAALAAAVVPAWEAASAAPTTALRRSSEEDWLARTAGRVALAGLALAALGVVPLVVEVGGLWTAYTGLLAVIAGAALAAPWATRLFARLAARPAGALLGPTGRMAARGIDAALSRTAVATAALAVAVAATIGIGVMIGSFRATVAEWLESSLRADVYLQPPSAVFRRGGGTIDPALARAIATLPGVLAADSVRVRALETERGTVDLFTTTLSTTRARAYRFKEGDPLQALAAARAGAVLVSEPLAVRFGLGAGDALPLPTDRGPRTFRVAGVYYDYGSDLGVVLMDDATFRRFYTPGGLSGLALYAAPGVSPEDLAARARAISEGRQALQVRSNRALRETSLALFDRTFLVTAVLRLLAVGVAFVGVLSALMALALERRRELAVLRAEGMTPGELGKMVVGQTALLGLWAAALALPLGLALAAALVYVVNFRSFGWTLRFEVDPWILAQAAGLAVGAALVAGIYPAWRMGRTDPGLALREE